MHALTQSPQADFLKDVDQEMEGYFVTERELLIFPICPTVLLNQIRVQEKSKRGS